MNTLFVVKNQVRFFLIFALSLIFAMPAFAQPAKANSVQVARFKDSQGHDVSVSYVVSSRRQLEAALPSHLLAEGEAQRAKIVQMCGRGPGKFLKDATLKFARDYVPEAATFHFAVGLSAGKQMVEDPAYGRHFYEQSLVDPMGHASFAGFMIANRTTAGFMSMLGLSPNPCHILRRNSFATLAELEEVKTSQKIWAELAGPIGMSAGLIVSTMVQQVMSDPNIQMCAAFEIGKISVPERVKLAKEACDKAYKDWVLDGNGKIRDLIPEMLSQTAVTTMLMAPKVAGAIVRLNQRMAAGATVEEIAGKSLIKATALRFVYVGGRGQFLFRGLTSVMGITARFGGFFSATPVGRIAVGVANMWLFLALSDYSSPWFKPMKYYFNGVDIQNTVAGLHQNIDALHANNYVMPKPMAKPSYCSRPQGSWGSGPGSVGDRDFESLTPRRECEDPKLITMEDSVRTLGEQEKKYRDFLMSDAQAAYNNWSDYVLNFTNMYSDARNFYSYVLQGVAQKLYQPDLPNSLFDDQPLSGVPVQMEGGYDDNGNDIPAWTTGHVCDIPSATVHRFDVAVNLLDKEIKYGKMPQALIPHFEIGLNTPKDGAPTPYITASQPEGTRTYFEALTPDRYLQQMRDGFAAMSCKRTPEKAMTDARRMELYNRAVAVLYFLQMNKFGILPSDDPQYAEWAQHSAILQLNLILGSPEPNFFTGVGAINALNSNPKVIDQEHKQIHPMLIGMSEGPVATPRMTDYLLTSMVCGPASTESIKERSAFDHTQDVKELAGAIPNWIYGLTGSLPNFLKYALPYVPPMPGWDIQFIPPRIINPIGVSPQFPNGVNICNKWQRAQDPKLYFGDKSEMIKSRAGVNYAKSEIVNYDGVGLYKGALDPNMTVFTVDGKEYQGMLGLVKRFANRAILGPDFKNFNFESWWSAAIDKQALPVFKKKREQFIELMNQKYLPVLNDKTRTGKGLAKGVLWATLDSNINNTWIIEQLSLKGMSDDELKLFNAGKHEFKDRLHAALMMSGTYVQLRSAMNSIRTNYGVPEALQPETAIGFDVAKAEADKNPINGAIDYRAVHYYKTNRARMDVAISNMYRAVAHHINAQTPAIRANLIPALKAAFENLKALSAQADMLNGYATSISLKSAF